MTLCSNPDLLRSISTFELGLGNDAAFLTARVSHKLGLKGPSYTVHTACSTSLAALHLACQGLLNDECKIALTGGIAINVPHKTGYVYKRGGILSPDGHCRAFDEKAEGTVFGSGAGVVVLKRAVEAIADGDHICALIKGSAVNNDGGLKAGFTAPSVNGQAEVISEALGNAGVDPASISYVEAHGTGTQLGDPIEIRALTKAYGMRTEKKQYCAIGSVKTNIGHLDAAAGVVGLIKTVLALQHKKIPASLHFEKPNPRIDFCNSPFYVNDKLREWAGPEPRRAAVSAFGVGGTNAHVILEEAPKRESSSSSLAWNLLTLSAKSSSALHTMTTNLVRHLRRNPEICLADVAYTLAVGRSSFEYRKVALCRDVEDAIAVLDNENEERVSSKQQGHGNRPVVFMFPGQGAQEANFGRSLYENEPVFRDTIAAGSELSQAELGFDLRQVLFPPEGQESRATEQLKQTYITQPAMFLMEYALAKLWESWGIRPHAMIGHSLGEYVAACVAGVFSFEQGLQLVLRRGALMQKTEAGAMLAVALSEAEALMLVGDELALAAVNGPTQCVLSGPEAAIAKLETQLHADRVSCKRLNTSHAFHSGLMESILDDFRDELARVPLKQPEMRLISNVSGVWITAEEASSREYWLRHLREPVRLYEGLQTLAAEYNPILLEVGPGDTLIKFARRLGMNLPVMAPHSSSSPDPEKDLTYTLGRLWLEGADVEWPRYYHNQRRHRVPLPTYPFERQRYWIDWELDSTQEHSTGEPPLQKAAPTGSFALQPRPVLMTQYVAPSTDTERCLARIWGQALGVSNVGVNDNFFELGGDSLIATKVISDLRSEFGHVEPVLLYEHLTIRLLAQALENNAHKPQRIITNSSAA
jgi:acyl transferase domain-containing protein